jgi:hypothetical protein
MPWISAGEVLRRWEHRQGSVSIRLAILNQVWEKEAGHLSRLWVLTGVRKGTLLVKCGSAAAAQELQLRSQALVRNLNKHFKKPWIKAIKHSNE